MQTCVRGTKGLVVVQSAGGIFATEGRLTKVPCAVNSAASWQLYCGLGVCGARLAHRVPRDSGMQLLLRSDLERALCSVIGGAAEAVAASRLLRTTDKRVLCSWSGVKGGLALSDAVEQPGEQDWRLH